MKRNTFGSTFGTVVVVGGSVVGLGNIWRFPYVAGENGGGAFILVYILVSILISIPIMLSEFSIGRMSRRNAMRAFKKLSPDGAWRGVGYLGIATAFAIFSFYSVVAGWAMEMVRQSVGGEYMNADPQAIKANFDAFVGTGWQPALWALAFIAATATIVSLGVRRGIEKFNKIAMPAMVLILILICVNSVTLSGFREGAAFILKPDFSKLNATTVLKAMGQSFFSLSLGMGVMITYGSYLKKGDNMFCIAGTVAFSDLAIAILAGLAIFPAVFTYGISPTSGPDLVFLTLPNIFSQMAGGQIIGTLFFVMLFVAAITSSVSLLEVLVAYLTEELRMKRRTATFMGALAAMAVALMCIVSQMPGSTFSVAGMNVFDLLDSATSLFMLPLGALLLVIFAGWVLDKKRLRVEMTSDGLYGKRLYGMMMPLIRFVIPIFIALLFLSQLGFLR